MSFLFAADQVRAVCPRLPAPRLDELLPHLNASLSRAEIDTALRGAMYIAHLAVESAELRRFREIGSPAYFTALYDVRGSRPRFAVERLGNAQPGDGARYCGRGAIQITGRRNTELCGAALALPLLDQPELLEQDEHAFEASAWYWLAHRLNEPADLGDVELATRRINGGLTMLAEREAYYDLARDALGC